jgi:predicted nucleic acid-binding protein
VSDTTPLHYLILIGRDSILEKLYGQVIVPPAVLQELRQPSGKDGWHVTRAQAVTKCDRI